MKKVFSIIALCAMTMSLSSFSDQEESVLITRNCSMEAIATYDFHMAFNNLTQAQAFALADSHYYSCISDGGEPGGPTIQHEEVE